VILTADLLVTGREVLESGWIEVRDEKVTAVGSGTPPGPVDQALSTVVPGFVDTHVHGGGGYDFGTATTDAVLGAVGLHRRHGTTRLIASLVTASPDALVRQVVGLAKDVRAGLIEGIHLEGPWLAGSRCGAHDPALLRDPERTELNRILTAGAGTIRMVTLAPERSGGIAAIERIVEAGVVAAIGHTEATLDQTRAAIDAGATVGTHLFNAMRPIHHREPGPIIALLADSRVTVEFIGDGVHVAPSLYRHVNHFGTDGVSLITDAMPAAGGNDGSYRLGSLAVTVEEGIAQVAGTQTIAGSTATMDQVFRFSVRHSALPRNKALLVAAQQCSVNPARALGLNSPTLTAGARADLVALDSNLLVSNVLQAGAWVT
jgi:N-acetylglucosamine-6-phosphate deacetylase